MKDDLIVKIYSPQRKYRYQETIDLELSIENTSSSGVLLVTPDRFHESGPPYIWKLGKQRIGVLLAEAELPRGFSYYGYNPPTLRSLPAGRTHNLRISVGMPPHQGRIEGDDYVWQETPVTGKVQIELIVGYLQKKFVPLTLAPWAEFLTLQQKTKPVHITVHISSK